MIYNPNQFNNIIPFVPGVPDVLILGGPADGNEAQCAVAKWPNLKVIGVEPCEKMIEYQLKNGWPGHAPILPYALSDTDCLAPIRMPTDNDRTASLMMDRPGELKNIVCVTIDKINQLYGPFKRAILWLDIEGWEYQALQGARGMFDSGSVVAVNVEILERRKEATQKIEEFFESVGFRLKHTWNKHKGSHHDRVYTTKVMR